MKDIERLLDDYDDAILYVVKAQIGDEYERGAKVEKAKNRLSKARKALAEELSHTQLVAVTSTGFLP